ncbi:TraC family protein [Xenorhabdus bovienii]|uniref:TraC family protein n=1 Tax=Xenorhabdus bovienii TaxID=40576 RepID=UPI0023B25222|nr:TraC family protein [Xenorhabdus bovienii]
MLNVIGDLMDKYIFLRNHTTADNILDLNDRDSLSSFLPFVSYKEEIETESGEKIKSKAFFNIDNTIGWIWELVPLPFVGEDQLGKLHNIIKIHYPKGTVAQWILYPDHNIDDILDEYAACRVQGDPITDMNVKNTSQYLRNGAENGIHPQMNGIPVRNFRVFYTLKCEEMIREDLLSSIEQIFDTAGMAPRRIGATELIRWMSEFFCGKKFAGEYNPERPLAKQMMSNDPAYERSFDNGGHHEALQNFSVTPNILGHRYGTCLFPNVIPQKDNNPLRTNELFGGYKGVIDDRGQIKYPFLYTLTIIYDELQTEIANKASQTMFQRVGAGLVFALKERINEFSEMQQTLAKGGNFAYFIPQLWVFGKTKKDVRAAVSEAKDLWGNHKFELMPETNMSKVMYLTALPFGFYNIDSNLKNMDRFFYADYENIARFLPVQGDFRGGGKPVQTYIGRKGQIIGLDMFDKRVNSHNFYVVAETGGGKSFLLNDLLDSYASCGAKIRITDLGASYKKLTHIRKGRYIDFALDNPMCMNPSDFIAKDAEDLEQNIAAAVLIYSSCAYSFTGQTVTEVEANLLDQACHASHRKGNQESGVDDVIAYLRSGEWKKGQEISLVAAQEIENQAQRLSFLLNNFGSNGQFKKFFVGKSEFSISQDEFVCVDLEKLKSQKQLFFPMIMQVMNAMTQDLYLSDRSQKSFILFEEIASMVKQQGNISMDGLASMVEEGYRRARKYLGAFGIVLQSPLDLLLLKGLGQVAQANAPFKYYLESKMYAEAVSKGVLPGIKGGFPLTLLESVKNARPRYGEVFIDSPLGMGVARLCVDKWRYWINTSDGDDVAQYNTLIQRGFQPVDALRQLSGVTL